MLLSLGVDAPSCGSCIFFGFVPLQAQLLPKYLLLHMIVAITFLQILSKDLRSWLLCRFD